MKEAFQIIKSVADQKNYDMPKPIVKSVEPILRADGYSLPEHCQFATTVTLDDIEMTGYGDAESPELAKAKALSEAIERFTLFYSIKNGVRAPTSNGWACHITNEEAILAAACELIERDVALSSWLNLGPYLNIPESIWPKTVQEWNLSRSKSLEFSILKIFLCANENGRAITTLLFNERGNFVSGHASALDLDEAITSSVKECLRAAHLALRLDYFGEVMKIHDPKSLGEYRFQPAANALAYAYTYQLPRDIVICDADELTVYRLWAAQRQKIEKLLNECQIHIWNTADRKIAYLNSEKLLKIFWGRTPENFSVLNKNPHIVG